MKRLITFATLREATPSLQLLEASLSSEKNLYLFSDGYVLITGIGLMAAATQTALHLPLADEVWNFGIAGALRDDLPIGTICTVQSVSKFLFFPEDIDTHTKNMGALAFPTYALASAGTSLISSDFPIYHPMIRSQLALNHHIVDMEGYGIAFSAKQAQKPFRLWKIISDFASQEGPQLIQQHIDRLAIQSAELISQEISNPASFQP
jgi:nucleoside phosphorylase